MTSGASKTGIREKERLWVRHPWMRGCRLLAVAALLALAAPGASPADESQVQVHLADGSSFPLLGWAFSYEYAAFRQGEPQTPVRRESRELWVGKRSVAIRGLILEIGGTGSLSLVAEGGKATTLRLEPPHRDFLLGGKENGKGLAVLPRSLDLRGQTLGGTKRQLCLLSYSTLVSCGGEEADRVVRVEFPLEAAK